MKKFLVEFPERDVTIRFQLLEEKAPQTCAAFWDALSKRVETTGKHAMYTGREISVQLSPDTHSGGALANLPQENLTCFPLPGDILFTYMPKYAFGGLPFEIFDIGIFYGRDARTFFPMGWVPGHLFAQVVPEDGQKLAEIGLYISLHGQQKVTFSKLKI